MADSASLLAFGHFYLFSIIVGGVAGLFWALSILRRGAAIAYLLCLATILEMNPSALRVIPGYLGWILLASCFIPLGEGSLLRKQKPQGNWRMPLEVYWAAVTVIGFSFLFSGVTKLLSPVWLEGNALELFFSNARFNWDLNLSSLIGWAKVLNYLTIAIEILFLPLYLLPKTRLISWLMINVFFLGTLILMRIYIVSIGMILLMTLLFPKLTKNSQAEVS